MKTLPWLALVAAPVMLALSRPAQGPTVAVVDLSLLMPGDQRFVDDQREMETWLNGEEEKFKEQVKELQQREAELEEYRPGSQSYVDLQMQLDVQRAGLDAQKAATQRSLDFRIARSYTDSYERIQKTIQQYAGEQGIDVVLQVNTGPFQGRNRAEVSQEIVLRNVVSFRADLDITQTVLSILNR